MEQAGRRAELIWDGKYDADGKRVAPLRVALPFQAVETVNESVQERQRNLLAAPGAYCYSPLVLKEHRTVSNQSGLPRPSPWHTRRHTRLHTQ